MARKMKKRVNLNKFMNNLIESKISNLLKKQTRHLKETISEMKKSIKDLEKKLIKMSVVKKAENKPNKKSKGKTVRKARIKDKKTCSIKGCNKPMKAKRLCNAHYVAAFRKNKKS